MFTTRGPVIVEPSAQTRAWARRLRELHNALVEVGFHPEHAAGMAVHRVDVEQALAEHMRLHTDGDH